MKTKILADLQECCGDLQGQTVLDLGIGQGENTLMLAEQGSKVYGIDIDAETIAEVENQARNKGLKVSLAEATVADFDPVKIWGENAPNEYDIVIFTLVLHFVKNSLETVKKVLKLAKSGGVVVFADLEDHDPVPEEVIKTLKNELEVVVEERFELSDEPHPGMEFPHQHQVYYLVGKKR